METRVCRHTWSLIPGSTFNWSAWMLETLKFPRKMTIDRSIKYCWGDLFPWCYVVVYIASSTITRGVVRPHSECSVSYNGRQQWSRWICFEECLCDDDVTMYGDLGLLCSFHRISTTAEDSIKVCNADVCHEMMKTMKTCCKLGFVWVVRYLSSFSPIFRIILCVIHAFEGCRDDVEGRRKTQLRQQPTEREGAIETLSSTTKDKCSKRNVLRTYSALANMWIFTSTPEAHPNCLAMQIPLGLTIYLGPGLNQSHGCHRSFLDMPLFIIWLVKTSGALSNELLTDYTQCCMIHMNSTHNDCGTTQRMLEFYLEIENRNKTITSICMNDIWWYMVYTRK